MSISDRIGQVIDLRAKNKSDFADSLNVTPAYVSKIINKGATPSDRVIEDICRKYDVSESWLRTGEGEMFIQMDIDDEIAHLIASLRNEGDDSFKKRLLALLANLTEEQWELLADLAQKLADK